MYEKHKKSVEWEGAKCSSSTGENGKARKMVFPDFFRGKGVYVHRANFTFLYIVGKVLLVLGGI